MAKLLIIDDDANIRESLRSVLCASGHDVFTAEDGEKGMTVFWNCSPEVIITDIFMPEKDGFQTLMELNQLLGERSRHVGIIAMSGSHNFLPNWADIASHMGASRTLAKPFDVRTLRATVAEVLGILNARVAPVPG